MYVSLVSVVSSAVVIKAKYPDISIKHSAMKVFDLQFSASWALPRSTLRFNFPPYPYLFVFEGSALFSDSPYCIASSVETRSGLTLDESVLSTG